MQSHGHKIPKEVLERDVSKPYEGNLEIQNLIKDLYQKESWFSLFLESCIDLDEGFQEWRYRHFKLVERIMGAKIPGTGGSSGRDFLLNTLFKPFFPDLWEVRSSIFSDG